GRRSVAVRAWHHLHTGIGTSKQLAQGIHQQHGPCSGETHWPGVLGSGNEQWARKSRAQRHQTGHQARLQSATRTSSTQVCRLTRVQGK
ncbi:MAG: hypothetical protein ACK55I_05400, partial [bacterium]